MSEPNVLRDCQASINTNELHGSVLGRETSRHPLISIEYFSVRDGGKLFSQIIG